MSIRDKVKALEIKARERGRYVVVRMNHEPIELAMQRHGVPAGTPLERIKIIHFVREKAGT